MLFEIHIHLARFRMPQQTNKQTKIPNTTTDILTGRTKKILSQTHTAVVPFKPRVIVFKKMKYSNVNVLSDKNHVIRCNATRFPMKCSLNSSLVSINQSASEEKWAKNTIFNKPKSNKYKMCSTNNNKKIKVKMTNSLVLIELQWKWICTSHRQTSKKY